MGFSNLLNQLKKEFKSISQFHLIYIIGSAIIFMEKSLKMRILVLFLIIAVINTIFQIRWIGTDLQWVALGIFGLLFIGLQIIKKK